MKYTMISSHDSVKNALNQSLDRHYLLSDEEIEHHVLQITTELDEFFNRPTEQTEQKVIEYLKNRESLSRNGQVFAYSSKESVQLKKIISDLDDNKEQVEFVVNKKNQGRQIESFLRLNTKAGVNFPSWISSLKLSKQVIYQAIYFYHLGELEINHYGAVRAKLYEVTQDCEKQLEIMSELEGQKTKFSEEVALRIYHFDTFSSSQQECPISSASEPSEDEFLDALDTEDDGSSVFSEEYFSCEDERDDNDFNHSVALASSSICNPKPLNVVTDNIKMSQKESEPAMQPSTLDVGNTIPAPVVKTYGSWWNSLDYMRQHHSGKLLVSTMTLAAGALLFHFMPIILAVTGIAAIFLHIVLPALLVAIGAASTMWIAKDSHQAAQSGSVAKSCLIG